MCGGRGRGEARVTARVKVTKGGKGGGIVIRGVRGKKGDERGKERMKVMEGRGRE